MQREAGDAVSGHALSRPGPELGLEHSETQGSRGVVEDLDIWSLHSLTASPGCQ